MSCSLLLQLELVGNLSSGSGPTKEAGAENSGQCPPGARGRKAKLFQTWLNPGEETIFAPDLGAEGSIKKAGKTNMQRLKMGLKVRGARRANQRVEKERSKREQRCRPGTPAASYFLLCVSVVLISQALGPTGGNWHTQTRVIWQGHNKGMICQDVGGM